MERVKQVDIYVRHEGTSDRDGTIVGVLSLCIDGARWPNDSGFLKYTIFRGGIAKVGHLEIDEERRGVGLGRKMVEYLKQYLVAKGVVLIIASPVSTAIQFWKKVGFEKKYSDGEYGIPNGDFYVECDLD